MLALLPLLVACQAPRARQEEVPPFVFRSLDLKQQDGQGRPAWSLSSPEARYDLRRRLARTRSPRGVIFKEGQPLYRLQATTGTVLNDGEAILLEGRLRLERLGSTPMLIQAERARWLPRRQLIVIDRQPQAYDRQGRLAARQALFRFDQDTLDLTGAPRLERWSKPFNPLRDLPTGAASTVLEVVSAQWQPGSGLLRTTGPVLGTRRPGPGQGGTPSQQLRAEGLEGNTLSQTYLFKGAVAINDPALKQRFVGRDVTLNLASRSGHTALPFSAERGALQIKGRGLSLEASANRVLVLADCQLFQPGERLTADRCGWNWQTGALEARGAVDLQRQSQRQHSRAGVLEGKLGPDGTAALTNPGGRVISRFQVPLRQR